MIAPAGPDGKSEAMAQGLLQISCATKRIDGQGRLSRIR
jgi:hypothetical protein